MNKAGFIDQVRVRKVPLTPQPNKPSFDQMESQYWDEYFQARRNDWVALGRTLPELPKEEELKKTCRVCLERQPESEFIVDSCGEEEDGRKSWCRSCRTAIKQVRMREGSIAAIEMRNHIHESAKEAKGLLPPTPKIPPKPEGMCKQCTVCLVAQSVDEFGKDARSVDGHVGICKRCANHLDHVRYHTNNEEARRERKRMQSRARAGKPVYCFTKRCPSCERFLNRFEFYVSKDRLDGLSSYCKSCQKERVLASRRRQSQTQ